MRSRRPLHPLGADRHPRLELYPMRCPLLACIAAVAGSNAVYALTVVFHERDGPQRLVARDTLKICLTLVHSFPV